jgi:hypothetical protein
VVVNAEQTESEKDERRKTLSGKEAKSVQNSV